MANTVPGSPDDRIYYGASSRSYGMNSQTRPGLYNSSTTATEAPRSATPSHRTVARVPSVSERRQSGGTSHGRRDWSTTAPFQEANDQRDLTDGLEFDSGNALAFSQGLASQIRLAEEQAKNIAAMESALQAGHSSWRNFFSRRSQSLEALDTTSLDSLSSLGRSDRLGNLHWSMFCIPRCMR